MLPINNSTKFMDGIQKEYTEKDIVLITGINRKSISAYADRRMVIPDIQDAHGRGSTRIYSSRNIIQYMLLKELSSHGLPLRLVQIILQFLSIKNLLEFAGETRKRIIDGAELTKEWRDNTWSSLKGVDRLSPDNLQHNELYLVLFDVNKKVKISLSEFPVGSSEKKLELIMRKLVWIPEESYSNIMIIDIRDLFIKIKDKL